MKTHPAPTTILTSAGTLRVDLLLKALGDGVRVEHLEANRWLATSARADGTAYHVWLWLDGAGCECRAGSNERDCKHVAACRVDAANCGVPLHERATPIRERAG